jgi:beta-fructofuranosidase
MWECVDLFRPPAEPDLEPTSPDELVSSAWDQGVTHHPLYRTGRNAGDTFEPLTLHRLEYGGRYFYAPQSMRDEAGRRVMFGWLQEGRSEDAYVAAGWSGVISLPRVVTIGPDGQLVQAPAPEVASLRGAAVRTAARPLSPVPLGVGSGDQLDIELDLSLAPDTQIEVALRATEDGSERTILVLERHAGGSGRLVLDRSASSLDATVDATPRSGSVPIGDDGRVSLRVLIDHSALEIFANGRALTARLYPTRPDALGVTVAAAGDALLEAAAAWPMHDIWPGPRPVGPEP